MKDASVNYGFESKSVVVVGYSNGANIAAGMLLARFGDAGAEVMLNWESSAHALTEEELKKAAGWLLHNFTN